MKNKKGNYMNVFSGFDGMSGGQIALEIAGITVNNYYASEIDKYAQKVAQKNYPKTIQMGDIKNWKTWDIDWSSIDLIIGGSPCQGFSFAGKQLAFDDPRSALFFEFLNIINHVKVLNPDVKFLMENVKMKKEYLDVISSMLGVEPIFINSSLVSAQNRQRYYWANWDFGLPDDKGIYLCDILEDGIVDRDKSHCVDANYFKGGNLKSYFEKHRRQLVFSKDGLCHVGDADLNGNDSIKRVYHISGKSPCLTSMGGGHREPKILHEFPGSIVGRKINPETGKRDDYNPDLKAVQRLEIKTNGKTGALTTVQKDNVVVRQKSKTVRSGGRGSLDRHEWDSVGVKGSELYYRKLTVIECERLQTLPDNYTSGVSNTQRYKMLGNGWTVDVIAHIFKGLK